jgi:cytochrome c-type biogenesis protein CcmH/NrfG
MTYQSETRRDKRDDKFYISWIIRGGIVLAIVIAVLPFISTGTYPDLDAPQTTITVPAPAS